MWGKGQEVAAPRGRCYSRWLDSREAWLRDKSGEGCCRLILGQCREVLCDCGKSLHGHRKTGSRQKKTLRRGREGVHGGWTSLHDPRAALHHSRTALRHHRKIWRWGGSTQRCPQTMPLRCRMILHHGNPLLHGCRQHLRSHRNRLWCQKAGKIRQRSAGSSVLAQDDWFRAAKASWRDFCMIALGLANQIYLVFQGVLSVVASAPGAPPSGSRRHPHPALEHGGRAS